MIKQPKDGGGCGIACVANIVNKTYLVTKKRLDDAKCKNDNDNITIPQLLRFFREHTDGVHVKKERSLSSVKGCAVVYLKWPADKRYKHWVLYQNGWYYDPDYEATKRTKSYITEPEVIIGLYTDEECTTPMKIPISRLND
jgi:hypothetical protein